jgi:hypothetical protein
MGEGCAEAMIAAQKLLRVHNRESVSQSLETPPGDQRDSSTR